MENINLWQFGPFEETSFKNKQKKLSITKNYWTIFDFFPNNLIDSIATRLLLIAERTGRFLPRVLL